VIANWGNKREYFIVAVMFEKNPTNFYFENENGEQI
jgi:hypothetical protein